MTITPVRNCMECGTKISGRADKKFCSDQCRNTFNNRAQSNDTYHVRNVNNILKRNRRILAQLNPTGKTRISGSKLKQMGFDFSYFTNLYETREGSVYHYCYEQGYLALEKDYFLLVVKPDFPGER